MFTTSTFAYLLVRVWVLGIKLRRLLLLLLLPSVVVGHQKLLPELLPAGRESAMRERRLL